MHIGSYDDEPATVDFMHDYMKVNGHELDFMDTRYHHEIYLSDSRICDVSRLKTVVRHPICDKFILYGSTIAVNTILKNKEGEVSSCGRSYYSEYYIPELSFVTELDGKIVGIFCFLDFRYHLSQVADTE